MKRYDVLEWGVVALIWLTDILFAGHYQVPMDFQGLRIYIVAAPLFVWPVSVLVSILARRPVTNKYTAVAENIAKLNCFSVATLICAYYLAISPFSLQDRWLIKIDSLMGFDWVQAFAWVRAHAEIEKTLAYAYSSLECQILMLLVGVGFVSPVLVRQFIRAVFITVILTLVVSYFVPSEGPFAFYQHGDYPWAEYTVPYRLMREQRFTTVPVGSLYGIVDFPSLHASAALILAYYFSRIPLLNIVTIILNAVMLVSTVFIGGHYLADILAGLVVAVIALYLAQTTATQTQQNKQAVAA